MTIEYNTAQEEQYIEDEAKAKESVYKIEKIGDISTDYGQDLYLLVTDNEEGFSDDTSIQICWTFFRDRYYKDTDNPGGWFCNRVSVIETPRGNSVLVIVHNERNI